MSLFAVYKCERVRDHTRSRICLEFRELVVALLISDRVILVGKRKLASFDAYRFGTLFSSSHSQKEWFVDFPPVSIIKVIEVDLVVDFICAKRIILRIADIQFKGFFALLDH